jgi:serine/threonine-protein kinase RsbW
MKTRTFTGNFESLAPVSNFIVDQAEKAGFSPRDVYAIQTAVDEACANIIDHAYGGENIGTIEINVMQIKNGIRIILKDTGKPFNPDEVPEPDISSPLEVRKERGLGIFFMRQLMDRVDFTFSQSHGNTLTLVKYKREE